jgi:hypothetical protein
MILVAVAALTMWLVTPAIRILSDPTRRHARHLLTRPDGSYIYFIHSRGWVLGAVSPGVVGPPLDGPNRLPGALHLNLI